MSKQYFENNPDLISQEIKIDFYFKKHQFSFISDNGIFSKDEVDLGTRILLKSLPNLDQLRILDLGCGYGIIGIVVAKLYPLSKVVMVDVNDKAIELSIKNGKNHLVNNIEVFKSNCYHQLIDQNYHFDVIITNPPFRAGKDLINQIVDQAHQVLTEQGSLIVVIPKQLGAKSLFKRLNSCFNEVKVIGTYQQFEVYQASNVVKIN